jgi:putative sterol carrier protein
MTPEEIFARMATGLDENAAKGLNATIQFNISGENGGAWYLSVKDGKATVTKGSVSSPSMTMAMTSEDYVDMNTGKLNPQMAFMSGKLKISGNMELAMKMQALFKPLV